MFKNVWVYGVASGWPESLDVLETALQRMAFVPAIASQDKSVGWIAPTFKYIQALFAQIQGPPHYKNYRI